MQAIAYGPPMVLLGRTDVNPKACSADQSPVTVTVNIPGNSAYQIIQKPSPIPQGLVLFTSVINGGTT
jgi:hypothetical protein